MPVLFFCVALICAMCAWIETDVRDNSEFEGLVAPRTERVD